MILVGVLMPLTASALKVRKTYFPLHTSCRQGFFQNSITQISLYVCDVFLFSVAKNFVMHVIILLFAIKRS